MPQVQMVALQRQNYAGRWVLRDETFLANESDVSDLEGMRPPLAKRAVLKTAATAAHSTDRAQPVSVSSPPTQHFHSGQKYVNVQAGGKRK